MQQMVTRAGLRPDRLLLVGGFGDSPYLQLKMENRYGARQGLLSGSPDAALRCCISCSTC